MQPVRQGAAKAAHRDAVAPDAGTLDANTLGANALDAWLVDLDAPAAGGAAGLDAAERARAASFVRSQDGARFAASRAALRLVLARYLGGEPADLEIRTCPDGRPTIAGDTVQFSLARSGRMALVAVSRWPVGADLEQIEPRPWLADLVTARFPAREAGSIARGCCGPPTLSFYRHWTAKEAFLKAVGLGLAGLRDVELLCGTLPGICVAGQPVDGWSLSALSPITGYVATVLGRTPVTSWRWLSAGRPAIPAKSAGWFQWPIRARS